MHALRGRALFFVPALALLAVFVVYPVVNTVWLSFFTSEGEFALWRLRFEQAPIEALDVRVEDV